MTEEQFIEEQFIEVVNLTKNLLDALQQHERNMGWYRGVRTVDYTEEAALLTDFITKIKK